MVEVTSEHNSLGDSLRAARKDNRISKDKHRGPRQCSAASNNSLFSAPGNKRSVF